MKRHLIFWILIAIVTLAITFVLSGVGHNVTANNKLQINENKYTKFISNEYIEFRIPQNWEHQNMQLTSGQLFNILCYSDKCNLRISSCKSYNMSHVDYFYSFKKQLFESMQANTDKFNIIEEKNTKFANENAIVTSYESAYQGHIIYGETIVFSKKQQMIVISISYDDKSLKKTYETIFETILVKSAF